MTNMNQSFDSPDLPDMYAFAGYPYKEKESLLIYIDGYKWRVFGNRGFEDVVNDSLLFSKNGVFGFPLTEKSEYFSFTQF